MKEGNMIVDTHVHIVSDDRKKYPRTSDGAPDANAPSVRDVGQPEWPAFTIETLIEKMDENGIDRALLVQTYYTYQFDNTYMIDCALAHRDRFQSVCVIDQFAPDAPDLLSELVEERSVRGLRIMHGPGKNVLGDKRDFSPLGTRIRTRHSGSVSAPASQSCRTPASRLSVSPM